MKSLVLFEADLNDLPSHVVDMQGVVGKNGVADCRDVGKGNSISIPVKVSVKLFLLCISQSPPWEI